MSAPFLSSRDTLAAALADHRWNAIDFACKCGWAPTAGRSSRPQREEHTAAALIASGVVVTPDVYLTGLADDEAVWGRLTEAVAVGTHPSREHPGDVVYATLRALAAALATPTTEDEKP